MEVSFTMRHLRPDSIRLKRLQRYFLYAVLALVFLSGVAWAYWNYLVTSPDDFETSVLTITGYGLYYAGGEGLRAWTSWIHLAIGMVLPILLLIHILLGKRTRPTDQSSTKSRLASGGVEDRHPKSRYYGSQRST